MDKLDFYKNNDKKYNTGCPESFAILSLLKNVWSKHESGEWRLFKVVTIHVNALN